MALDITSIPAPVTQWANRWLSKQSGDLPPDWRLLRLAGDGSARQFFRLLFGGESRVVLYDPGWRFTKDYAAHQSFLIERGLPVPRFGEEDPDAGFLIMEDLGDVLAQSRIRGAEKREWLQKCVRLLAELHGRTHPVPETLPAFGRAFDREIYGRELRFTIEHLRVGLLGVSAPADLKPIDTFAKSLEKIGPRVFCHRDYHTRNLLVHNETLYLIDFQDARMGPAAYDLCSLLYDAYVPIEADLREELVELYQKELERFALSKKIDWPNFREELRRVAYQRTLKAAGSFASFFTRYGKKTHLPYLHPCFDNIMSLQSVAPTLRACFPVEEWLPKIIEWEKKLGHSIKKAMILAAGLGTRMAPVTDSIPKPLVPILNIPNIIHNIQLLTHAGIEEIVINTFHLGSKLAEALGDGTSLGVQLHYSVEETLLGTGGGVKHAEKLLGNEAFVLCNSDLITDLDLNAAIDFHFSHEALATMVLLDDAKKKRRYANVGTDEAGRLCQLPSKTTRAPNRTGIFTGIHILQPDAHRYLKPVFSGINQVLYPQLMEELPDKAVGYYASPSTCWLDTGEVPIFWETSMALLKMLQDGEPHLARLLGRHEYRETTKGFWSHELVNAAENLEISGVVLLGEGCDIGTGVKLGSQAVIGRGSTVGPGAHIERAVLLPGAHVTAGAHLTDTVVFGDRQLLHK